MFLMVHNEKILVCVSGRYYSSIRYVFGPRVAVTLKIEIVINKCFFFKCWERKDKNTSFFPHITLNSVFNRHIFMM